MKMSTGYFVVVVVVIVVVVVVCARDHSTRLCECRYVYKYIKLK